MRDVIDKYAEAPFVWGETDCCQFVGECVESMIGENPAKRIKYHSEKAARKLYETHGGLEGVITMLIGEPTDSYRDGSIGLVDTGELQVAGVFYKDRIICRTETGIVDLPAHRASRIWPCRV